MNASRSAANAYGDFGKVDFNRGRRGRELWEQQTRYYEKMNKCQPVTVYKIAVVEWLIREGGYCMFAKTFWSPYEQYANKIGQKFKVIRKLTDEER